MKKNKNRYINKLLKVIKIFVLWFFTLLLFFVLAMMLFRGPMLFLYEFSDSAKGIVEKVKVVRGGHDLFLSSNKKFHWILNLPEPIVGDKFDKEKYSFRYMVNGKNRATKKEIMILTTFPMPYKYAFILFGVMIIFQTIFYKIYKKSPPMAFIDAFQGVTHSKMASVVSMYFLPVLFVYYTIYFFVLDFFL